MNQGARTIFRARHSVSGILSLMLICISVTGFAQTGAGGGSDQEKKGSGLQRDQFKKMSDVTTGARKISISPVAPATGIKTGVVMAYGHIIPPPYQVTYSGNRLLINGVQVSPSLVKERHRREHPLSGLPPAKQAIIDKAGKIMAPVQGIYDEGKRSGSVDAAQKKILDLLLKHPDIFQHPKWQGQELCYETPAYQGSQCIGFGPSTFSSSEAIARNTEKNKAMEIAQVELNLKEGKWVCFGSMGGLHVLHVPRDAVRTIMSDSSLSKDQRIGQLREALRDFDVAFDIAENYDETEWHEAK